MHRRSMFQKFFRYGQSSSVIFHFGTVNVQVHKSFIVKMQTSITFPLYIKSLNIIYNRFHQYLLKYWYKLKIKAMNIYTSVTGKLRGIMKEKFTNIWISFLQDTSLIFSIFHFTFVQVLWTNYLSSGRLWENVVSRTIITVHYITGNE